MTKQTATFLSGSSTTLANGTTLKAEGLAGNLTLTQWTAGVGARYRSQRSPADEDTSPQFRAALEELGIYEQETIHLDTEPSVRFRGAVAGVSRADRVYLRPAPPAEPGAVQVVLYQDEAGALSWHFADPSGAATFRGTGGATFTIDTRTAAAEHGLQSTHAGPKLRGPITKWGRKIFKVLVLPALQAAVAPAVQAIVGAVERKFRQELIRPLTPQNYNTRVTTPFADWAALKDRRSLLVVHGIFSTTEGVLSRVSEPAMEALHAHYGGRMIAFDQQTVSRSPEENARFFLETLEREAPLGRYEFDVLCHSRGGIVSRTLAERGAALVPGSRCAFSKIFFVATPNNGSVLGDAAHMVDMIDVFTNLLTHFPDGPALYSIEVILAIVKLIAYSAERNLPGLAAMGTDGYISHVLNRAQAPSPAQYAAASANYTPDPAASNGLLAGWFGNVVIDRIFRSERGPVANDLVVPTDGVAGANSHPSFPIHDAIEFGESDHVWHTGFFGQACTWEAIHRHFAIGGAAKPQELARFEVDRLLRKESPAAPRYRGWGRSVPAAAPHAPLPAAAAPSGAAATIAPPTATELRREPTIHYHELVNEGVEQPLVVALEQLTATVGASTIAALLAPGATEAHVDVTLRAPGFTFKPASPTRLVLKAVRDPALEQTTFLVTPQSPGAAPRKRELCAEFWQDNTCLGSISHYTTVVPKNWSGPAYSSGNTSVVGFSLRAPREQCDLKISVQGDDEEGLPPFRMSLDSIVEGKEFSGLYVGKLTLDKPGQTLDTYLAQMYQAQFDRLPQMPADHPGFVAAYANWQRQFNAMLDGLGRTLWKWLPQRFRDKYFELRLHSAPVRSLLINSDEMILPWELVIPNDGATELPPLGRSHVIGRWKPGEIMKPQPQRFRVRRFCIVNPTYPAPDDLPSAARELAELKKMFPKASVVSPADLATVQSEVFGRNDVNVFHFSGHGDYQGANADLSDLRLENGTLQAVMLTGARFLSTGSPIVYLNACHAGATGSVVGRAGGFSANLISSGSGGVIAPYWPVEDERAADFALTLYQKLQRERSIGEALQELREEHPQDLTYRAFSYLGDPWTRLDFSALY